MQRGAPKVEIQTTIGNFVVELYIDHAPKTCKNFLGLVDKKYYDGTPFHRIIRILNRILVSDGDSKLKAQVILAVGLHDSRWRPYWHRQGRRIYLWQEIRGAGILSMANSGPNTNGSQFFITLAPTPHLDGKHTIFGRVYSGMGNVQRLGNVQTDAHDKPINKVSIITARRSR